ncbi:MAG: hypothetical protein DRQ41_02960 [Gammaproteobacteria bacterium]|nr:MAG: hypothetical protein DRQ41_02960 [Gammaproteobacteria bacterium]
MKWGNSSKKDEKEEVGKKAYKMETSKRLMSTYLIPAAHVFIEANQILGSSGLALSSVINTSIAFPSLK